MGEFVIVNGSKWIFGVALLFLLYGCSTELETKLDEVTSENDKLKEELLQKDQSIEHLNELIVEKENAITSLKEDIATNEELINNLNTQLENNIVYNQDNKEEGKMYYDDGTLKYEGGLKNGFPDGQGIAYEKDGFKIFEGEFKEGKLNGQGIIYGQNNKIKYEGNLYDNQMHGEGKLYFDNETLYYKGEFLDGNIHGIGTEYYYNGNIRYYGEWKNGMYDGQGIAYHERSDGLMLYDGPWVEDKAHGKGYHYPNGYQERVHYDKITFINGVEDTIWTKLAVTVTHYEEVKTEHDSKNGIEKFVIKRVIGAVPALRTLKLLL